MRTQESIGGPTPQWVRANALPDFTRDPNRIGYSQPRKTAKVTALELPFHNQIHAFWRRQSNLTQISMHRVLSFAGRDAAEFLSARIRRLSDDQTVGEARN